MKAWSSSGLPLLNGLGSLIAQFFFFAWGIVILAKANNALYSLRLEISFWEVDSMPGEPGRVGLGATISSSVFSSRIFLRGSWEARHWLLAWAAVNSLSTGVVVCSQRELRWLVSLLTRRSRQGSGDWDILIVHRV